MLDLNQRLILILIFKTSALNHSANYPIVNLVVTLLNKNNITILNFNMGKAVFKLLIYM